MMAMVHSRTVVGMCGAIVIRLRITDIRPHRIPVGIIIKIPRIAIVPARESKAESFDSASDKHLGVRTLYGDQCQSSYRHCH